MRDLIKYLAGRITDYFIKKKIILAEDKNIYIYGGEITISTFIGISIVIIIGLISYHILDSILFLLCFIPVRIYTGGYHADTYIKCNLIFGAVFIMFLVVKNIIPPEIDLLFSISIMILSITTILILSPIENKYKPLYGNEKIKYKIMSIIFSLIWCICSIILYIFNIKIYLSVALTMFTIATSMVVEILKQNIRDEQN